MLSKENYFQASVVAQAMVSLYRPSLQADGKWGSYSQAQYDSLSVTEKLRVRAALSAAFPGVSTDDLLAFRRLQKASAPRAETAQADTSGWVSLEALGPIIDRVTRETGASRNLLVDFLNLEARKRVVGGVTFYDPNAVNSLGYRGLGQFDAKGEAWARAAKFVKIGPFAESWRDPYQNLLATAGYIKANTLAIRSFGYTGPITGNIAYLMHNQGAKGAYSILTGERGVTGGQSKAAIAIVAAAKKDATQA